MEASATETDEKPEPQETKAKGNSDIQCFVLRLKERLEKKELKNFIGQVRQYKQAGDIKPLADLIKSYATRKFIHAGDINDFRHFVRKADIESFDAVLAGDSDSS